MEERAEKTLNRVREALEKGEVAGVPEVIRLIQELSAKAFSITIKELADLISRDVAVTAKVISAANTVGYNPWAIPISTVSQAIQVIGFERVRNLAISLLLAENAERTKSEEQREAAALALHSGFVAQEIAELSENQLSPEQAFICASLRNYGRLIMTTFLLDDYRKARELEHEIGLDDAFHSILGLTPLELGYHLLLSRNMPEAILSSLQEIPKGEVDKATKKKESFAYLAIAEFSARLSDIAIDHELDPVEFEESVATLSKRFEDLLPVPEVAVGDLLRRSTAEMKSLHRSHGLRSLSDRVMDCLGHRLAGDPLPPPLKSSPASENPAAREEEVLAESTNPPFETKTDAAKEEPDGHILQAIEAMTEGIGNGSMTFPKAVFRLLQAVHNQLGSTDSILFMRDRKRGVFAPRLGLGPIFDKIRDSETIDPANRDVFGICLTRLEDVFVMNATEAKINRFLPGWLKARRNLASFLILPIQDAGGAYGLIWSGRTQRRIVAITPRTLTQLRALRTHVSTIKNLHRAQPSPSVPPIPKDGETE